MTIQTLLAYFIGDRSSILRIAGTRNTLLLGALFVFSAALAREYDGEDLIHRPWHLMLPLAASLLTSLLLFTLLFAVARRRGCKTGSFRRLYSQFLRLYWMTAPLAWLYAIPVEQFMTPGEATRTNLCLLALVAVWRVALITRVVAVLFEASYGAAFFPVMLFADSLTVIILYLTPLPVFSIMGGIRLTESARLIQETAFLVGFFGIVSWPIWAIGTLFVCGRALPDWKLADLETVSFSPIRRPLWGLAFASIIVWIPILGITQPKQQLRYQVETNFRTGHLDEAITLMTAHDSAEFPPHWDPPPRIGYGEDSPSVFDILEVIERKNAPARIRAIYIEKLNHDSSNYFFSRPWRQLDEATDDEFTRILTILEQLPEGAAILKQHRGFFERQLEGKGRSEALCARIAKLLEWLGDKEDDAAKDDTAK